MSATKKTSSEPGFNWLDRPVFQNFKLTWEIVLFALIMIFAVVTRFYKLEDRVMSHDETSHVYYSWKLSEGQGYEHLPMTHGPFQFHVVALSYFLLGDNDFTARIPAVLLNLVMIAFIWKYRRWLGKAGTLIAMLLAVISPYSLYYARYVRNESFVGLFGLIMIWGILRYLETGKNRYMYFMTIGTVLHYTSKETAFIYSAQALLFLGLLFVNRISQQTWKRPDFRRYFLVALILAFVLLGVGGYAFLTSSAPAELATPDMTTTDSPVTLLSAVLLGLSGLGFAGALGLLLYGFTPQRIFQERSASIIIVHLMLLLPMLAPLPMTLLKWDAQDYTSTGLVRTAIFMVPLLAAGFAVGIWWNRRQFLINAAIFYSIFTVLYTTLFTNGIGFFTGIVGSLAYWIAQQEVQRGSQPWYYYAGLQVPFYEFLPLLLSLLAVAYGIRRWISGDKIRTSEEITDDPEAQPAPALVFFGFWIVTSLLAFTYAGEKMPWLTYHISLLMYILGGWALGQVVEKIDWAMFKQQRGWLGLGLALVFVLSLGGTLRTLVGGNPPFQGATLEQLRATANFVTSLVTALLSGWGLFRTLRNWSGGQTWRLMLLSFFGLLAVLTAQSAFRASYINYNDATEYLVYAHSAGGIKEILKQIEEISLRTTDGYDMLIAYDNESTYPYWWYLRNYTNQRYFGENPTRDVREAPIILVGDDNFGKIEPIVARGYYQFNYIRMWWPNQDYYDLTWERIWNAVSDPQMREAILEIWLDRDYTKYATITEKDLSLSNWNPSDRMRMYIRKDVVSELWNYGVAAEVSEADFQDPYEGKAVALQPVIFFGQPGSAPGQLQGPRGLAVAPDGTLYVADSRNHRIQQFDQEGTLIRSWGTFANILEGEAPPGTFNEPWDVAVGPDGAVYVADTWNHRIQKFSAEGEFITMWGYFGQGETGDAFWGPRSVAVSSDNRVFVSDTGNKRIVIFDGSGAALGEVGEVGMGPAQFDEPVGIALDAQNNLYVADTWNQRVQVLSPNPADPNDYLYASSWDVVAWYGQSLENKPYLAVDSLGRLFAADPEGYRVLQFTTAGGVVNYWGDYSAGVDGFALVSGVETGPDGTVWVSDAGNNRILKFQAP